MTGDWLSRLRRIAAECLAGGVILAVLIFTAYQLGLGLAATGFICLTVLVLLSLKGSFTSSIVLSTGAVASMAYFFSKPIVFNLRNNVTRDVALVIAFLVSTLLVTWLMRNIRKQSAALRESEQQWKEVFEQNPAMYFLIDAKGTILSVNSSGALQLGYAVSELVGRPVTGVVLEADQALVQDILALCAHTPGQSGVWEARTIRKDGGVLWARVTAKFVQWGASEPIFLISCEDVTQRKEAEEALRQAYADLARASRITIIGELTASLAHEVNQPITAAVANANACLRWLATDTPDLEEVRAAAEAIVRNGARAAEIIDRTRRLFEKGAPQREPIEIGDIVRETVFLLGGELSRHGVSIRTFPAASVFQIEADRVQLQQVLMNLILNAIEAMKEVEGRREIAIKSQIASEEHIVVSVSDTGVGLPAEKAEHLFDTFVTTKPHGTGMGLSISRSIISAHGGRLWAEPNEPCGAVFRFTLPSASTSVTT
jgi:PAS domain S-box-containing protein